MKAIILASGQGKRLLPLTKNIPKSLIRVHGKTLLEHQLDILTYNDIENIIITTGPFSSKISNLVKERYSMLSVNYVHNPIYDKTNYIYSLWLTRDLIDDDIILLHGDLLFSNEIGNKIKNTQGNAVVVSKTRDKPEKDFKAVIEKNKVKKIGVNFFGKNSFFCLPLYKFVCKDFMRWMKAIDDEMQIGNIECYAEDALNKITDEITLQPVYIEDSCCMEIDTLDDLKEANKS